MYSELEVIVSARDEPFDVPRNMFMLPWIVFPDNTLDKKACSCWILLTVVEIEDEVLHGDGLLLMAPVSDSR